MQVSVESIGGLKRRMVVSVPDDRIESKVSSRINEVAKTIKMDGFRPGKVPISVVKNRYQDAIRQEIMGEVMRTSFDDAVKQESIKLAGPPEIVDATPALEPGKPFEFKAEFEVFPEFELNEIPGSEFTRKQSEITDQDVDDAINQVRESHATWTKVDRAAKDGDRVTMDYVGTMDGKEFVGGSANDVPLVLGSNTMIPGFEDGLLGVKPDEERSLDLEFPKDYSHQDYAGKAAQFAVTVKSVEEPALPEMNEEFLKGFGLKEATEECLKTEVRKNLEKDLENIEKSDLKEQVATKLIDANEFDTPSALIKQETHRLKHQAMSMYSGGQQVDEELLNKIPDDMYQPQAEKNVKLGLIMSEIIKKHEMKADPAKVKEAIEKMAEGYGDPEQLVSYYYNNEQQLETVQNMVLEEQVIDQLIENAKVTDKKVTYKELREQKDS